MLKKYFLCVVMVLLAISIFLPNKGSAATMTYKGSKGDWVYENGVLVTIAVNIKYTEYFNRIGSDYEIYKRLSYTTIDSNEFLNYSDITSYWASSTYSTSGYTFSTSNFVNYSGSYYSDGTVLTYYKQNTQSRYVNSSYSGEHRIGMNFQDGDMKAFVMDWPY